jgi:dTDP-4-dehydrorhamnose 3,5-epimerase
MIFTPTTLPQVFLVDLEKHPDERGFFGRVFCEREFARAGLPSRMVQASFSWNRKRGTLRGLHFQWPPSREAKLVRCIRGSLIDVLLDLRPRSATRLQHLAVRLDAEERRAVCIPPGVAHGFQTLEDDTEILYQMSDYYAPELSDGVRWNDPAFAIEWPVSPVIINDRDAGYLDYDAERFRHRFAAAADTATGVAD